MEVRAGYQQTEVSVIPSDWEVKKLGDIFSISAGGDLIKGSFSPVLDEEYSYPIYSNSLANRGLYGFSRQYRHDENCVTVTARGTIGAANAREHKFDAIGRLLVLKPTCEMSCFFVAEYINHRVNFSIESTGVPQLTAPQIMTYEIGFPKPYEQMAIATALSDADALISGLEKLIAKKQNIKQGAMQELLTGKKRLPGFSEKWEVKKLGNVCGKITTGKLDANAMVENGEYRFYTCAKEYYWIDRYAFDTEALLVSGNGANVGYIHHYKGKFNAYQRTYVLFAFSEDILYIKLFMDRNLQERIRTEVNAGNTPYIKKDTLAEMEIQIPPSKAEQTAIAQILSDMDAEIEELEHKLAKYKMIKLGMMQELLTGKKRLI